MSGSDKSLVDPERDDRATSSPPDPAQVGPRGEAKRRRRDRPPVEPKLSFYFGNPAVSATDFVRAVRAAKIHRFADDDTSCIPRLSGANDPNAERLWSLVAQPQLPEAIERWASAAVYQRLKSDVPSVSWSSESDPSEILRTLRVELGPGLSSKKKPERRYAEILLRLGTTWLVTQRSLDLWVAFDLLGQSLYRDQQGSQRAARRLLTSGRTAQLREAVAVVGVARHATETAKALREEERARYLQIKEKFLALESDSSALRDQLTQVTHDRSQLNEKLSHLQSKLDEEREHGAHDLFGAKARYKSLLNERLAPLLRDAIDALEIESPALSVALDRLRIALKSIEESTE